MPGTAQSTVQWLTDPSRSPAIHTQGAEVHRSGVLKTAALDLGLGPRRQGTESKLLATLLFYLVLYGTCFIDENVKDERVLKSCSR